LNDKLPAFTENSSQSGVRWVVSAISGTVSAGVPSFKTFLNQMNIKFVLPLEVTHASNTTGFSLIFFPISCSALFEIR
jgi:hypothetical protein